MREVIEELLKAGAALSEGWNWPCWGPEGLRPDISTASRPKHPVPFLCGPSLDSSGDSTGDNRVVQGQHSMSPWAGQGQARPSMQGPFLQQPSHRLCLGVGTQGPSQLSILCAK